MLNIHRADRADALATALAELFATPLDDPFAPEVIAVHTRGVERWLTQTLSTQLGIVANVRFPSPREIVDTTVAAACGIDPQTDPWAQRRTLWPLLELVDEHLDEPWLQMLAAHLRDSAGTGVDATLRRLPAVRHLAWLFDRYALERPAMLRAWQTGEDPGWQATLWRALRERIGCASPAERLPEAAARLRAEPELADLPPRLALFGLTRLPRAHAEIVKALAEGRDVHVFVLHPSPALWDRAGEDPQNRLLASWGRDVRELQLVLPNGADHHHDPERPEPQTLLKRLQTDVRADHRALGSGPPLTDRSIEIHSCHGRARQVEVLRDAILHTLQSDRTLEPRDVIVMCPDIETFAPLIHATFGAADVLDDTALPDLRVRLADRALRQTNPVLGAIGRLLELADERLTASQVLDFADRGPVRRRFNLDDDDLVRIKDWIAGAEIRWGLDAPHRAPFKLEKLAANTWRHGLDRILTGVAMTEDDRRLVGGALPLDDVGSGDIDLAGRFAELIERLQVTIDRFAQPLTMAEWAREIAAAADLLTDTRDAWQRAELDRLLQRFADDASDSATLALAEVLGLLAENLRGRPTRANFRTGHLTFCTLNPMRTVPHRVVCLLGLDDGVFPRIAPRDGDDLIVADRQIGDRDGRSEDRQMLLDALMSAQDKLIVTYTGNDERTNAPKPPAVPVGELLDVIRRTVDRFEVTRHPLQPFDRRNFEPPEPSSFDPIALGGAQALDGPRAPRPAFLSEPLPPLSERVVELADLERFVAHPARAFLRRRLGISLADYSEELKDDLPIDLDGLESWGVGERLLAAVLAGVPEDDAVAAQRARGALPPGRLGDAALAKVLDNVRVVADTAKALGVRPQRASLDVRAALPGDRVLSGTVAGLDGDQLQAVSYSRVNPRQRLTAWVRLLALSVAHERPFEALTIGRRREEADFRLTTTAVRIAPVDNAREHLDALVQLYDEGMREPPPLACRTSAAFAEHGPNAARKQWTSEYNRDREDKELEHRRLYGGVVAFDDLDPRFADWAQRLWTPLLAAEETSDL